MSAQVTYRMARPDDSGELARYMCIAGGGVYEFLFDDLIPFMTAVDLLSAGAGWDEIPFPELADEHAYALEITGESMLPVYRDGDRIVVSPSASVRRGDRVVVKTQSGEVMAKQLSRHSAQRIELKSFNPAFEDRGFALDEVAFMHRIIWASQ